MWIASVLKFITFNIWYLAMRGNRQIFGAELNGVQLTENIRGAELKQN